MKDVLLRKNTFEQVNFINSFIKAEDLQVENFTI